MDAQQSILIHIIRKLRMGIRHAAYERRP